MEGFMRDMDRLWSDTTPTGDTSALSELHKAEDGGWVLRVLVPGFKKEEINVDVSRNHISIDANREETTITDAKLVRGGFPTSLSYREQVPAALDPTSAEAELKDGVLTVSVRSLAKTIQTNKIVIK
jgi:HSP20 family molecular chaperone IbpA